MSRIFGTPTARSFGAVAAGPVISWRALAAGAEALGIEILLTADGQVSIDGFCVRTLAEADARLEVLAAALGQTLAFRAMGEAAEQRAIEERRAGAVLALAAVKAARLAPWRSKAQPVPDALDKFNRSVGLE